MGQNIENFSIQFLIIRFSGNIWTDFQDPQILDSKKYFLFTDLKSMEIATLNAWFPDQCLICMAIFWTNISSNNNNNYYLNGTEYRNFSNQFLIIRNSGNIWTDFQDPQILDSKKTFGLYLSCNSFLLKNIVSFEGYFE